MARPDGSVLVHDGSAPFFKLCDIMSCLKPFLPYECDWKSLRLCSRSLRSAAESAISKLSVKDVRGYIMETVPLPASDHVSSSIRGLLLRGGRPEELSLWFVHFSKLEAEQRSLAVLDLFKESRAYCITKLNVAPALLTPAVAAALARAAPSLTSLDMTPHTQPLHSAWDLSDVPGLPLLLHSVKRTLCKLRVPLQHGFPPGVMEALRGCSALEELELALMSKHRPDNVAAVVSQLPLLTQLRSLSLSTVYPRVGDDLSVEQWDALDDTPLPADALEGLTALTGLTKLSSTIGSAGVDLSSTISGLRSLRDLFIVTDLHMEHLAGLTNLTRLHAERILVPEGPPPAGRSAAAGLGGSHGSSNSSGAAPPSSSANRWPLPPRLYKLWVEDKQPLAHLARLAAPESLLRVRLEPEINYVATMVNQITFTQEDTAGTHALPQDIVAAFPTAVELMKGRLKSEKLLVKYTGDDFLECADPRVGHSPWLAALAPLALRELWLEGVLLDVGDVHTIAGQLSTLQCLSLLECSFLFSSLPVLARMPRLRSLSVHVTPSWEGLTGQHETAGAIATLLQSAPGLERLSLKGPDEGTCAAMRDEVRVQLARLGRSAEGVRIGEQAVVQGE